MKRLPALLSVLILTQVMVIPAMAADYDVVINNGRVMDHETNFDGVRNVGVKDGKIAVITKKAIKGRMQEGMDADIVVFNPDTVKDNSTYEPGMGAIPSTGIPYVLVNGTVVVKDSIVGASEKTVTTGAER